MSGRRSSVDRKPVELETSSEFGRVRRSVIRSLGVVALLTASLFPVFAITDAWSRVGHEQTLEPAGSPEAQYGADHPAETIHIPAFVAMAAIAASGLAGIITRPGHAGSATQTGAVGIAMLMASGIAGDPDNFGGQGLLVDPAVVALAAPVLTAACVAAPWREWRSGGIKRPLLLLLGLLALPALWFGVDQALLQRNTWPPLADPHHQTHWIVMAQLAFSIPLVTVGAALSGRGWRLAAVTASIGALAVGIFSIVAPQAASSLSTPWAIAATLWAGILLAFIWRRSQHTA